MPALTKKPKHRKTIRLTADKIREIKKIAKKKGKTQQYFYENAIEEYLKKFKNYDDAS